MKLVALILRFFHYLYRAKSRWSVHSPFLYELISEEFRDRRIYPEYERIEMLRKRIRKSRETIEINDLGTGGKHGKTHRKKIKKILRQSVKRPKEAQFLFRLVRHHQPHNMLELGTSLGLTTIYQHMACQEANFVTIEGSRNTARYAEELFHNAGLKDIRVLHGNFDDVLPHVLEEFRKVGYVFFDGNHTKEATLKYFDMVLPFVEDKTLLVFDDIHWSSSMEEAWNSIKKNPKVTLTIDVFHVGLVYFRKAFSKQDFIIRY